MEHGTGQPLPGSRAVPVCPPGISPGAADWGDGAAALWRQEKRAWHFLLSVLCHHGRGKGWHGQYCRCGHGHFYWRPRLYLLDVDDYLYRGGFRLYGVGAGTGLQDKEFQRRVHGRPCLLSGAWPEVQKLCQAFCGAGGDGAGAFAAGSADKLSCAGF